MKLVLASRNEHKRRELGELLAPHELEPLPAGAELPPELGTSFAENALGKARAAAELTGRAAIGEDSGIEAEALGGAPGVRSARYAGESASDTDNLNKLLREAPSGSALAYVCALAYVDPLGCEERLFEGRCAGRLAAAPKGEGGFGYDPAFLPDEGPPGLTMAELEPERKNAISHRGQAARALLVALDGLRPAAAPPAKQSAALLSVASNSILIALKVVAGIATGSVAILTEAAHSSIDLVASLVAFVSVRKSDEPADAEHLYGHEKVENLAAWIEGALILFGAAIIGYESIVRLVRGSHVHTLGVGIAVIAVSLVANTIVSRVIARRARETESAALEGDAAHLGADAATSAAVLVGLVLVQVTGASWIDPAVALLVAGAILFAGVRLLRRSARALIDEALPEYELELIRSTVSELGAAGGVIGSHRLRARRAGSMRHVDLHVQFAPGTSLEGAHHVAHQLQHAISERLGGADVLIHAEPADSVRTARDGA